MMASACSAGRNDAITSSTTASSLSTRWTRAAPRTASAGVGAMTGARGCVDQLQAPDASAGVCTPGIYRVSAVWQGLNATATSAIACGSGLYGNENLRRVVAIPVSIALPLCK